ncbi:MAG: hypothetical protein WCU80_12280 [Paludibacteraceae bacterium]|nr:hypothetical protein [Prevotellaceae bacterium]
MQDLEGIWLYLDTPEDTNTNNTRFIMINKSGKNLGYGYELEGEIDWIGESYYGFQDYSDDEASTINVEDLKTSGKYYTEISKPFIDKEGFATVPHFSTPEIVEISESTLWINYGKVSIYEKIDNLSEIDMKLLYLRGKKDNRDYIKEYLNLDVREITAPESIIYSEPDKSTKMHLTKGDMIFVVEEKNDWIKIEHSGENLMIGWIKKEDVK